MGMQNKKTDKPIPEPEPARYPKPRLGDRITFTPTAFVGEQGNARMGTVQIPRAVTGWVTYINERHRYFKVDYEVNRYKLSECFKF